MGWVRDFGLGEKFWVGGKILGRDKSFKSAKSWQFFKKHWEKSGQKVEKKLAKSCKKVETFLENLLKS